MRAASQPLVAQVDLNALIARRNSKLCGLKLSGGADRTRSGCQGKQWKKSKGRRFMAWVSLSGG